MFFTEILCKLLLLWSCRPDNTEVPLKRIIELGDLPNPEPPSYERFQGRVRIKIPINWNWVSHNPLSEVLANHCCG